MKDISDNFKSYLHTRLTRTLGLSNVTLASIPSSRDNHVFFDKCNNLIIRISLTKFYGDAEKEAHLLSYLEGNNFLAPKVLDFGSMKIGGREYPFTVFEYVKHLQNPHISKHQVGLAARYLGKLHGLTASYCKENRYTQERTLEQDLFGLCKIISRSRNKAINRDSLLKDLDWGIDFYNSRRQEDAKLILHNDYRINNVLFASQDEIACVIDFDWSVESSFALKDLGHAALEWSFPDGSEINRDFYNYFIGQYWESNPPIKEVPISEVWSWSRFSALTDAAHYFLSFPERTKDKFISHMYDKYLYFKDHEA